jgi:1-deoxy-D-xylulose-5-phosphate reductoisomerase
VIASLNLLGSTGSIGVQTLSICARLGLRVSALAASQNIGLLTQQARAFLPDMAVTADPERYLELKTALADIPVRVMAGADAVCEAAAHPGGEMTLNAVVGIAGLRPTLAALRSGRKLALANKESVVAGGGLVMAEAAKAGNPIFPVDSEHSAIFQCLNAAHGNRIERILLTASGGPFFGRSIEEVYAMTPAEALRHPTYSMGTKLTVDSATLMNKGLELIEAMWLFDVPPDKIEIVVHPQSVVHSAVEFCDGSVIAQMGTPDMALPIQYALTYPGRLPSTAKRLDLAAIGSLTFAPPDPQTFTCLRAALRAARMGGTAPAALNGANEEAVAAFLAGRIPFGRIGELVEMALPENSSPLTDIQAVFAADAAARQAVRDQLATG